MKRIVAHIGLLFTLCTLSIPHTHTAHAAQPSEADAKKVVKLAAAAAVAYDKGNYTEALDLYTKAHKLWTNPKLSFAIAKSYEALKQYKKALQAAQRGLTENPKAVLKARLTSKVSFLKRQLSKGTLTLLITPSGATIKIDGKEVGTAPVGTLSLSAGSHTLELSHPGYSKIVQGVTIKGGVELKQSFTLQALTGKLSVTSTPSGATVEIDGKAFGKTPLNGLSIPAGSHNVTIKATGYKDTSKRVTVSPKTTQTIAVVLRQGKNTGALPSPGASTKGPWFKSWPGWTTLVLGLGAGAVGAVFLARAGSAHAEVNAAIKDPSTTERSQQELTEQWNQANGEEKAGYALVGVGGGLVILSVILFATQTGTGTQTPAAPAAKTKTKTFTYFNMYQRSGATHLLATE